MGSLLILVFSLLMLLSPAVCISSNPNQIRTFQHGTSPIVSVRFTPDNARVFSACVDGAVVMWDLKTGERIWQKFLDEQPRAKQEFTISHVMDMEISPDGQTIAISYWRSHVANNVIAGKDDERLVLLNTTNGQEMKTLVANNGMPRGLAFAPDGRSLVSVGADRIAQLWDLPEGKERWSISLKSRGVDVAFSADGKFLAIATEAEADPEPVGLYEAKTGGLVSSFPPTKRNVGGVAFLPNSPLLAVSTNNLNGGQIEFWDTTDNQLKRTIKDDMGITFSRDGRLRASSGSLYQHGTVVVRDVATNEERVTRKLPADPSASDFSSDSRTLAVGTEKGEIVLIALS